MWAAGLYKGWVSKHNPCTILKRKNSLKKITFIHSIYALLDVDMLSTKAQMRPKKFGFEMLNVIENQMVYNSFFGRLGVLVQQEIATIIWQFL